MKTFPPNPLICNGGKAKNGLNPRIRAKGRVRVGRPSDHPAYVANYERFIEALREA